MSDGRDGEELRHRDVGEHTPSQPRELVLGWMIECSCGWDNEIAPAADPEAAREQHRAHVASARRHTQ